MPRDEIPRLSPANLFVGNPTDQEVLDFLAGVGFRDPASADRLLQQMAEDLPVRLALGALATELFVELGQSPDRDAALVGLSRYLSGRANQASFLAYLHDNPEALRILAFVLGSSPVLAEELVRDPGAFHWLLAQISRPAPDDIDYDQALTALAAAALTAGLDTLKRFRRRENLRIASRDLLGLETLESATAQLAFLADTIVERALRMVSAGLAADAGLDVLPGRFAVIGMGKLGGQELNYSSDIDLLYVYEPAEGAADLAPRVFEKLARALTAALSEHTSESYLYRVDLRLRPGGRAGAIVYALDQYAQYYDGWGETFERFALLKARPVAGDRALGERFLERVQPFVYRRYHDHAAVEEMARYQVRIERETRARPDADRDVKTGRGGIREIEVFAQVLQITYGAERAVLRQPNTLAVLAELQRAGLLAASAYDDLSRAYVFLRTVEHRLQIVHDQQTHSLSRVSVEREICARRLGFASAAVMDAELEMHRTRVHDLTRTLFERRRDAASFPTRQAVRLLSGELDAHEARELLDGYGIGGLPAVLDTVRSIAALPAHAHPIATPRTVLANLLPLLFERIARSAEPERLLIRFEQVTAASGAAPAWFKRLLEDDTLRERLFTVLDAGELPAQRLIRFPDLLESLLLPPQGLEAAGRSIDASLARMTGQPLDLRMSEVRRFKQTEELKVIVQWLADAGLPEVHERLSTLAERIVGATASWQAAPRANDAPSHRLVQPWAIIALGTLGSRELTVHSDLDLVIVYEGDPDDGEAFERMQTFARLFEAFLEEPTSDGTAYRVDTRLRPEGTKGALAMPRLAFERYLQARAEPWERMAWTRHRTIAGDPVLARTIGELVDAFVYGPWDAAMPRYMAEVRRRMERERSHEDREGTFDFKVGRGGLADIDFCVQLVQIREGATNPAFRVAGTRQGLTRLASSRFVTPGEVLALDTAYLFLRRLELVARLDADAEANTFTADTSLDERLGRRLGLPSPSGRMLVDEYRQITDRVRGIFRGVCQRLEG